MHNFRYTTSPVTKVTVPVPMIEIPVKVVVSTIITIIVCIRVIIMVSILPAYVWLWWSSLPGGYKTIT
jgi:hypothetical protein